MAASMSLRDEAVTSSSLSSSSDPLDSSFLSSEYSLSAPESSADSDFAFARPDFAADPLAGTVDFYDRHVFLCYKNPRVWPPRIAAAEFDRVPRLLSAALSARKPRLKRQTRLTICEGHDGTETSNGDVLIFPDMVRYRRLTHFDVETFVEEVLVNDSDWLQMTPESLQGSYIFVCCHGSRDRRCGVCGPALVSRFRDEIELHGLLGKVSVSPCSHIGGHKYAGNVIIFSPSNHNGEITGHWYGYVTPEDVTALLELHIGKGEIVDRLWRGQMGLSKEEQIGSQNSRLQMNGKKGKEANEVRNDSNEQAQRESNASRSEPVEIITGCCKGIGNGSNGNSSSCCQNTDDASEEEKKKKTTKKKKKPSIRKNLSRGNSGKGNSCRRVVSMPTWLENWERDDTYAALAVAFAALSVAVAYSFYRNHTR